MNRLRFSKDYTLHYHDVNVYQEAMPISILRYMEETAISHSDSVGYGIEKLKSQGLGWILNRWLLEIKAYPKWNQKITVETWPSEFKRFYATRHFQIKDQEENVLVNALSLWILLDISKKRPQRIPEEIGSAYGTGEDKAISRPFSDFKSIGSPEVKKDFAVRRSDIDTNNHVNNTKYLEWILESVPQDIYDNYSLSSFEIVYKKEVKYGDVITSICNRLVNEENMFVASHSIINKQTRSEAALAKTLWVKRT